MGKYIIAAASFNIFSKFTHNFWCLKDESNGGRVVAQLHGLATSLSTGEIMPVGYLSDHRLNAHYFVYDEKFAFQNNYQEYLGSFRLKIDLNRNVYDGEDSLAVWNKAIQAIPLINELNLAYPPGGLTLFSNSFNSNSMYHTFADLMGLTLEALPNNWAAIGVSRTIYPLIKDRFLNSIEEGVNNSLKTLSLEEKAPSLAEWSNEEPIEEKREGRNVVTFFQSKQEKTDKQPKSAENTTAKNLAHG